MIPLLAQLLVPDAHALDLLAPAGLKQGRTATFVVTGGTPGQTVGVAFGGPAPGACPPVLGGLCLDLSNPVIVDTAVVRADGTAILQATVPAAAPLVDVRLQAAQTGPAPAVSPVRVSSVLTELTGNFFVRDTGTFATASRAWKADTLIVDPGGYPVVLSFPHLERAFQLEVSDATRDLTLPALVAIDYLSVVGTPGARVTAPALVGPDTSPLGTAITAMNNTGDVQISAPALVRSHNVSASTNSGSVVVEAPAIDGASVFIELTANSGDLSGFLPTLARADTIYVTDHAAPTLDVLPSLLLAGNVYLHANASLQRIVGLGAPGVEITAEAEIHDNPVLSDPSGFGPSATLRPSCQRNPALASCTCEAFMATAPNPRAANCQGNAPDTCSDTPADLCF